MSYHNGSVWPHDNALIAAGLKRYGFARATNRVATALFDAAIHADYLRLPELFCGFTRRSPNKPVRYPVACSPAGLGGRLAVPDAAVDARHLGAGRTRTSSR